jgi:Baseplate J-like protein
MTASCSCGCGCDCGCCEGIEPLTPQMIANRPGLDALAYRVGTHSTFLETMKARLSSAGLAGLTTREASDPAIALLDAWAVVGDVLTFYQERIANEGYLRTATERRSVLELARLIGYAPRPGVASSVYLAYALEEKVKPALAPGAPAVPVSTSEDEPESVVPAGSRVQSVPGPGEMPQPFETSEDLAARAAWNNLQVRLTRPQSWLTFTRQRVPAPVLHLKGIGTNLKPNDPLLIGSGGQPQLYRVRKIEPDAKRDRTRVEVEPWEAQNSAILSMEAVRFPAEALREALARFTNLEALGIAPGATAQRVVSLLEPSRQALDVGEPEARTAIDEALPKLRDELAAAERQRSTRLAPWISRIVSELEQAVAGSDPVLSELAAVNTAPQTTDLSKVLGSLGKRPTVQPRGSRQLDRDAAALFGPGSDLPARLLTVARREPHFFEVYALRARASVFGNNAPRRFEQHVDNEVVTFSREEWILTKETEDAQVVWLDAPYPQILPGSWIVLLRPRVTENLRELVITRALRTHEQSREGYGIAAKGTRIEIQDPWLSFDGAEDTFSTIRGTAVFAQSERLELAEEPIADPLCGQEIELAGLYDGLEPGRWLIVTGERADLGELDAEGKVAVPVVGVPAAELVMVGGVAQGVSRLVLSDAPTDKEEMDLPGDRVHTTLTLAKPLAYCYKRDTVTVHGNVAHATHGETRFEVLGSGDGAKALQPFTLKQPPLTWISAPTPSGIGSTLQVRVDDLLWHEAASLAGLGPTDRSYVLRTDDEARTTVVFGNGERGARLPTGRENVRATYRSGIGTGGNVKAGQISQLATRPLGVKGVINPLPASGGAGPESRDQARRNAPLAVMALDRLISVQDYEDFARTFAGVGKASAARLTDGRVQLVHVTIAGEDDIPILEDSDLFRNLEAALRQFGDPRQPLRLEVREAAFLFLQAKVRVLPDYEWDKVEPKIRAALLDAFGFARRDLGQDALLSEVYRTVQGVRGVDLADVDIFDEVKASVDPKDLKEQAGKLAKDQPNKRLRARPARNDKEVGIRPAQLLYLTPEVPDTLVLKERK